MRVPGTLAGHMLTNMDGQHISVEFDLAPVTLDLQRAVPCGFLINEIFSNACKHAPGKDGVALLAISDGLPAEVTIGKSSHLDYSLYPFWPSNSGAGSASSAAPVRGLNCASGRLGRMLKNSKQRRAPSSQRKVGSPACF